MLKSAMRAQGVQAPPRDLWQSIPLDLIVSAIAIIAAAGLTWAGVFP